MPGTTDRLGELRNFLTARLRELDEERRRLERALRELGTPGTPQRRRVPKERKPRTGSGKSRNAPKGQQAPRPKPKRGGKSR